MAVELLAGARLEAALELARFTGWVEVLGPDEVRRELAGLGAELVDLHGVAAGEPGGPSPARPGRSPRGGPGPGPARALHSPHAVL